MLRIHFIDDSTGHPLCSTPESDRWLWTINRRAVTCPECVARLGSGAARQAPRASGPDEAAAPDSAVSA